MNPETTRFAPSPTGLLHLGHAYSALFARRAANGGTFILRMEDIDATRCRPEYDAAIREDLLWLGFTWPEPVRRQSEHMGDYHAALDRLEAMELLYPCFCTRRDIQAEIARAGAAPHGPDGPLYPGTCRALPRETVRERIAAGTSYALRINMKRATAMAGPLTWRDRAKGVIPADPSSAGDVVLARKETPTSYHLAVTLDDHLQGVTLVTRGKDLFHATHVHRLLQALLGLDTPEYHHHPLLLDAEGRRLAKRDKAPTLRALREAGATPQDVVRMAGWDA